MTVLEELRMACRDPLVRSDVQSVIRGLLKEMEPYKVGDMVWVYADTPSLRNIQFVDGDKKEEIESAHRRKAVIVSIRKPGFLPYYSYNICFENKFFDPDFEVCKANLLSQPIRSTASYIAIGFKAYQLTPVEKDQ